MDSAGVPLLYPLDSNSSPWGIRCGGALLLPRVWDNLGSCIPVQVDNRQFRMLCSYLCSVLDCSRFSRFCLACIVRFSLVVGWTVCACGYVGFCYGLSLGLPLTAPLCQFRWMQAHFTKYAGCKSVVKTRSCSRNFKKTGIPYSLNL